MKKLLLLTLLLGVSLSSIWAQGIPVTGNVQDENGESLIGVSVTLVGTSRGTVTDFSGNFEINVVDESSQLEFSFLGYNTIRETVGDRRVFNIYMTEAASQLSELVVVGYGAQARRDVTGSISSISGEEIENLPVASLDAALQGRAAGVNVLSPSGTPGAGISVQIRGLTSLSASNQPLYVIDGIPMIPEDLSGLFSGGQATNSLADLNPSDIASIEILKDASATAIYGSRGANGVVLITTKRGKAGKTKISMNAYYGSQTPTNVIQMHNSSDFLRLMDDAARQDNRALGTDYPENFVSNLWGFDPDDPDLQNTRWYEEIFRPAAIQSYDLSASGGTDKTQFFTSFSYFNQDGVQVGTGFERYSARMNLDTEVNSWLKVGTSMNVNRTVQDRTINDNSLYGVVINTLAADPLMPVFEEDGSYADPFNYFGWWMLDNPMLIANEYSRFTRTVRGLGSMYAEAKLAKGLSFRSQVSIDYNNVEDEAYTPIISRESRNRQANGFGNYFSVTDFTWIAENYLTYNTRFADKHNFTAVAGNSYQASNRGFTSIAAERFPSDDLTKLTLAALVTDASTSGTLWGISSYFGRFNYSFDDRYLVTFTARADGSSRFGQNFRYGFFPSGSVAWRISEESFMKNQSLVSDLKLRASYGITGNQDGIGNFASRGLYGFTSYRQQNGLFPIQMANLNLTWESTAQFNAGLDLGFWNNRLNLTVDYFIMNTDDLLQNRVIPGISGFTTVTENIGSVRNSGLEIALGAAIFTGQAFRWTTSFNISTVQNEITRLAVNDQILNDSHILSEGHPIGTFFLIDQEGVDPQTGDIRWIDENGDGVINSADRRIVGNALPRFFGGWNNTISYKGFDLNLFFQFTVGNMIFNHSRASYENLGFSRIGTGFPLPDGNNHVLADERWMNPGDETDIPRASLTNVNWREYSSRWLEDGSFLRLRTINFGYNVPRSFATRAGLESLRVYVQGQNLLTFTGYTGFDPEVNQNARNPLLAGADFGTYPQVKSVSFGFNVNF